MKSRRRPRLRKNDRRRVKKFLDLRLEQLEPRWLLTTFWQNESFPEDVDGDGVVAPADVLTIINAINASPHGQSAASILATPTPQEITAPYLDVTGDDFLAAGDALQVINYLNSHSLGADLTSILLAPENALSAINASVASVIVTGSAQETRANTTTLALQETPAVASSTAGSIIVWTSDVQDGSSFGIYGQRLDATGKKVGGEFRVNQTTRSVQRAPTIAAWPDGRFVVAWEGLDQGDDYGWGVYARLFKADGSPASDEIRINQSFYGTQRYPSVAVLVDGTFAVAWEGRGQVDASHHEDYEIFVRQFNASGVPLSAEQRVNSSTDGYQEHPAIVALPSGGFAVAWNGYGSVDPAGVYLRRYSPSAFPLATEILVNNEFRIGDQRHAALAANASGQLFVAWSSTDHQLGWGVYGHLVGPDGNLQGSEILISQTLPGTQWHPSVTALGDGSFITAWEGYSKTDDYGIYTRQFSTAGQPYGKERLMNWYHRAVQRNAVVVGGQSSYVIAWDGLGPGDVTGVFYQGATGGTLPPNNPPVNVIPGPQSVLENKLLTFSAATNNSLSVTDTDVGADTLRVALDVTAGTLTLATTGGLSFSVGDGTADSALVFTGTLATINSALVGMQYKPATNFFGQVTLTMGTSDLGHNGSDGVKIDTDTIPITVTHVNQQPSFTAGTNPSVLEDSGPQTIQNWATKISAGPSNEAGQKLSFQVAVDNPTLFSQQPEIAADGTLTFTPAANAFGSTVVTYSLKDDGGTANGGLDTTASVALLITITPVNDAPTFVRGANQSVAANVGAVTFPNWATNISAGPANETEQTLQFVVTVDQPGLFDSQPSILSTGALQFSPKSTASGTSTIHVRLKDSGGTASGGQDTSSEQVFTITTSPVSCPFDANLAGWTVTQSGGSTSGQGTVSSSNCQAVLREGDSFTLALEKDFVVPAQSSALEIKFSGPTFDTTDTSFINDAFEIAVLDANGSPLVRQYASDRDAQFNLTEGLPALFRDGVEFVSGNTVHIGLGGLPEGIVAHLVVRLVNNDSDNGTTVSITDARLVSSSLAAASPEISGSRLTQSALVQSPLSTVPAAVGQSATVTSTSLPLAQATGLPIVSQPGFEISLVAQVPGKAGSLALAPRTGGFAQGLYIGSISGPYEANGADAVYRLSPIGDITQFSSLLPEADPFAIEFPPSNSPFGDLLYVSANNRDGGRSSGQGGTIQTITPSGLVSDFTSIGLPTLGEPCGLAFNAAGPFSGQLYIANSSAAPAAILRSNSSGQVSTLLVQGGPAEPAPGAIAFGPGGAFGGDLYFGDIIAGQIRRVDSSGVLSPTPLVQFPGFASGLEFGPGGRFGQELFVALTNGTIYRVSADGVATLFADGFSPYLGDSNGFTYDGLEFDAASQTLYVAEYNSGKVYAIRPTPDPLQIAVNGPAEAIAGATVLLSGRAIVDASLFTLESVTINGAPVEVLDQAGNFFTRVTIAPGNNHFHFSAQDSSGSIAQIEITVSGTEQQPSEVAFGSLSEVTGAFGGVYRRTSYQQDEHLLYVDLATRNNGTFFSDVPLLVGIKNISEPTVSVLGADGVTPDGIAYYDFTQFVTGGKLQPGQETGSPTITFFNPRGVQFDYELVFYGKLNEPPAITTVPLLEALIGKPYAYDVNAVDPDADAVQFALAAGPAGMSIDAATGVIAWTPLATQPGNHDVKLRVTDGRGGSAEQHFILNAIPTPPNRPPIITSTPVIAATVRAEGALTILDFESLPRLTLLTDQFRNRGVRFNSTGVGGSIVDFNQTDLGVQDFGSSGRQAVDVGALGASTKAAFVDPQTGEPATTDFVSIRLGDGDATGESFAVSFFDLNGNVLNVQNNSTTSGPLTGGVTVTFIGSGIASVEMKSLGGSGFSFDDFVFNSPSADSYHYRAIAIDPDFDPINYALLDGPQGMTIHPTTGLITWAPIVAQIGDNQVKIQALDGRGGVATQEYTLCVLSDPQNHAPIILTDSVPSIVVPPTQTPTSADFRTWTQIAAPDWSGHGGSPVWQISPDGAAATLLFNAPEGILASPSELTNYRATGTISVQTNGDDDFFGLAFGVKDNLNFFSWSWRSDREGANNPYMRILAFENGVPRTMFLKHIPGWIPFRDYEVAIEVHLGEFSIEVRDGDTLIEHFEMKDQAFEPGKFGLYVFSQGGTEFRDFAIQELQPAITYEATVITVDPDNDVLTYALAHSPPGMTIDASAGQIQWTPSLGNSVAFDGINDYIEVPYNTSFPVETFTLSAWINRPGPLDASRSYDHIVAYGEDTANGNTPWALMVNNDGHLTLQMEDATDFDKYYPSNAFVADGQWHHVAATRDSAGKATLFVDGLVVAEFRGTITPSPNSRQSIGIGASFGSGGAASQKPPTAFFKGSIDEVQVWNIARTEQEIAADYKRIIDPASPGLVGYWRFDEGQDSIAHDLTSFHNDGILGGDGTGNDLPAWSTSNAPLNVTADVTVRVEDGRGGSDEQSFTINVVQAAGEIRGTKFNDLDGSGSGSGGRIVVGHDVNTLSTSLAGAEEEQFAVNLAKWLTRQVTGNLLFVEAGAFQPTSGDYAPSVLQAVRDAGFTITKSTKFDWTLDELKSFDAVFVGMQYSSGLSINNSVLRDYVNDGGGVYLFGGVNSGIGDNTRWNTFLNSFGLQFVGPTDNGFRGDLPVISDHRIFEGISGLQAGDGNSIVDLDPNDNAGRIIATYQGQGIYAAWDAEPGLSGWTIYLDQNQNGRRDLNERFTITDASGNYSFPNLAPGNYYVAEEPKAGWEQTTAGGQSVPPALYAVSMPSVATKLYRIDNYSSSPVATIIGDTGVLMGDLAIDPTTGRAYGITSIAGAPSSLYSVDLATGTPTLIGSTGITSLNSLDFAPNGILYAMGPNVTALYSINLQTGLATAVFDTGFVAVGDLAFESDRFAYAPVTGPRLLKVDLTNKTAAIVGPFGVGPFFPGLDTDETNQLFGGLGNDFTGLAEIYRVDQSTGFASLVGPVAGAGTIGLGGMSFDVRRVKPETAARTFEVSIVGNEVVSGIDFGNRQVSNTTNHDPTFSSTPPTEATADEVLKYLIKLADSDGDSVTFDLPLAPPGMTIHPSLGIMAWQPTLEQIGSHSVVIRARDNKGGVALQSFDIKVVAPNSPPVITSSPGNQAVVGLPYLYRLTAQDADGDSVQLSLPSPLTGMTFDSSTGVLNWTPTAAQLGSQSITLTANDGRGFQVSQAFTVSVVATAANDPPVITSLPRTQTQIDQAYLYRVVASDSNGDPLNYQLDSPPVGMTLDAQGVLRWRPTAAQAGANHLRIRVRDGRGGEAVQDFDLNVVSQAENAAPAIVSNPRLIAVHDQLYRYDAIADDADGDAVVWSLDQAPIGMSIDPLRGTIRWTPVEDQLGEQVVILRVQDALQGTSTQRFTIDVQCSNLAPVIVSVPPTKAIVVPSLADISVSLPGSTNAGGKIAVGTYSAGTRLDVSANGTINLVNDSVNSWFTKPDGSLASTVTASRYNYANIAATGYPQVSGGDGINHFVGGGANYDAGFLGDPFGFAGTQTTDTSDATAVRFGAIVGTFAQNPTRNDWFLIGTGVSVIAPNDGATLFLAVNDTTSINDVGSYSVVIHPTPPSSEQYTYPVRVQDDQDTRFSFFLDTAPAGMTIDNNTGVIQWQPTAAQVGLANVVVRAVDSAGAAGTQAYTIKVSLSTDPLDPTNPTSPPIGNRSPIITSTPVFKAEFDTAYQYDVSAIDPDGDAMTFSLTQKPTGMAIDPSTGLITWTPTTSQTGPQTVSILVRDARSATATQTFVVVATANQPPAITSTAATTILRGQTYRYSVRASDPNGDPLTFSLDANAPSGMTIDNLGRIIWQTSAAELRGYPVTVTVRDDHGQSASQSFTVTVSPDTQAPTVNLTLIQGNQALLDPTVHIGQNSKVLLRVAATDNIGITTRSIRLGDQELTLDATGTATVALTQLGQFDVIATATDAAGNSGTATRRIHVFDPADTEGPTVIITSPANSQTAPESTVTYIAPIIGTIDDPDNQLAHWEVFIARSGLVDVDRIDLTDPDYRQIGHGTTEVINGQLAIFDPTLLENDQYFVAVQAFDTNGQGNIRGIVLNVQGNAKLGNFHLEFTDLTVPVAGIPIQISRIYDTLQADTEGAFGYGWSLGIQDADIRETVPDNGGDFFSAYPFKVGTRVYVTTPEGKRVGFTFDPEFRATFLFGVQARPRFKPDPGVYETLQDADSNDFAWELNADGTLSGFAGIGVYNPSNYILTTKDSLQYHINQYAGLQAVSDLSGNRLEVRSDGIFHSSGEHISFERDSHGRITKIIDPAGNALRYTYDAAGDLRSFTNQENLTTGFTYYTQATGSPHFLKTIVDPLQRTVFTAEFDENGRLKSTTDALGAKVQQDFDPTNFKGTFTDALGKVSTILYDLRGNVVSTSDPAGNTITYEYDANDNLVEQTDARGFVTRQSFDARGNRTSLTDAQGGIWTYDYNSFNKVTRQTDPLGRTATTRYDNRGNVIEYVNPLGISSLLVYDAAGRPISLTDNAGHETLFVYGTTALPIKTINSDGTTRTFEYNNFGLATQISNELGDPIELGYDDLGRLLTITDPRGGRTSFTYDRHLLVAKTDALGRVERYEYDAANRRVKAIDALGGVTTTEYDANGRVIAVTDPIGRVTRSDYRADGRLLSTTDATGAITRYEYDAGGNQTAIVDALGRRQQFTYDALGRVVSKDDCPCPDILYAYDLVGNLVATTDKRGNVTRYQYDALNRQIAETDALGGVTRRAYDANGNLASLTDANGQITSYEYDQRNHLIRQTDPTGAVIQFGYDAAGNQTTSTDALGNITGRRYDALGRLLATTEPGGGIDSSVYDLVGNRISSTDALGRVSTYQYDALNRLITQTNAEGGVSRYEYDQAGNRTAVVDPLGNRTTFGYDSANRLVRETDAQSESFSFAYDAVGNRTEAIDRNGRRRTFEYDDLNRLKFERWWNGAAEIRTFSFAYDAADNLISASDPSSTYAQSFDALNRLTGVDNAGTLSVPRVALAYSYDPVGNLTRISDNLNAVVTLAYSPRNEVIRETLTAGAGREARADFTYNAVGQRAQIRRFADAAAATVVGRTTFAYNTNGDLTDIVHRNATDTVLVDYDYFYDLAHQLVSDSHHGQSTTYAYDRTGQLTSADRSQSPDETFAYDANGNRSSATTIGTGNRLLVDADFAYRYDNEGNRIEKTSLATQEKTLYSFDLRNRLTNVERRSAGGIVLSTVDFTYDVFDRRIATTTNGVAAFTAYDRSNAWVDFNAQGGLDRRFLFGPGYDFLIASQDAQGANRWYLADNLYSIRDVAGPSGTMIDHIDYSAFGQIIAESNSAVADRFRFTGREWLAGVSLYNYRARFYDPHNGRFISEDPIRLSSGDNNFYRYVGNAPLLASDPAGTAAFIERIATLSPAAIALVPIAGAISTQVLVHQLVGRPDRPVSEVIYSIQVTVEGVGHAITKSVIAAFGVIEGAIAPNNVEGDFDSALDELQLIYQRITEASGLNTRVETRQRQPKCDLNNPATWRPHPTKFPEHVYGTPQYLARFAANANNPQSFFPTAEEEEYFFRDAWFGGGDFEPSEREREYGVPVAYVDLPDGKYYYTRVRAILRSTCIYHAFGVGPRYKVQP